MLKFQLIVIYYYKCMEHGIISITPSQFPCKSFYKMNVLRNDQRKTYIPILLTLHHNGKIGIKNFLK